MLIDAKAVFNYYVQDKCSKFLISIVKDEDLILICDDVESKNRDVFLRQAGAMVIKQSKLESYEEQVQEYLIDTFDRIFK